MISQALGNYPHIRFHDEERMLWNPVLRKSFKNRPEERVRLQLVAHLIEVAGFSKNRMSFESPVTLVTDKTQSRTDLICYDDELKPLLLCECKATSIKLNEKAAHQIARYNTKIEAPYLLITNGMTGFWFHSDGNSLRSLQEVPEPFKGSENRDSDKTYWTSRGFLNSDHCVLSSEKITELLNKHFRDPYKPVKYLKFDGMPDSLGLEQYYSIHSMTLEDRFAFSFSSRPADSRFTGILNRQGDNIAYFSASLNEPDIPALFESANGKTIKSMGNLISDSILEQNEDLIRSLYEELQSLCN